MGFPINPDGTIDYDNPAPTPTRLTDGAAGYVAPSEAAMELSRQFCQLLNDDGDGALDWFLVEAARLVDAFAAQQAAAAVKARDAEIIAALEQQKIVDTNPHALTEPMKFYNGVLGDAIGIIHKL